MVKILCIGNSFSEDATTYLQRIAKGELYVRNMAIGGCSLERHYNNIMGVGENLDYAYEIDGECVKTAFIEEALTETKWDYITVQQVSHYSGIIDTYEPFLGEIVKFIREKCPEAKIVFHRTWAYSETSDHGGFVNYDRDRTKMFNAIVDTTTKIAEKYGFDIIPCGNAVEMASQLDEFKLGGPLSMHRDGFHLTLDYGRYLAALVMCKYFTGCDATKVEYEPEDTDKEINAKLKEIANKVYNA